MKKTLVYLGIGFCLVLFWSCGREDDDDPTSNRASTPSLYQRLGGEPAVTAVVGQFTENVVADQRINCQFAKTDPNRFKRLLVQHLCLVTGGGCGYTGKDMYTVHKGMGITSADFTAVVEDLIAALDFFSVPEQEKTELLTTLGGMQGAIVEKKGDQSHQCSS